MKKLFLVLAAILLMATSAYAFTPTEYGTVNIETVYITDMGDMVSGDVVILKTTSPTYWGREVTGTTTAGRSIYGVVLGDPDITACKNGTWIRVQTYGYCPIVKLANMSAVTANTSHLVTSSQMFCATSHSELNAVSAGNTAGVTGNSVALESKVGNGGAGLATTKAYLSN